MPLVLNSKLLQEICALFQPLCTQVRPKRFIGLRPRSEHTTFASTTKSFNLTRRNLHSANSDVKNNFLDVNFDYFQKSNYSTKNIPRQNNKMLNSHK